MENRNIVGLKIKKLRIRKELTQEQLAARLNVLGIDIDRVMLSRIENQTRYLLDYEIKGIAEALEVKINELFKN